MPYVTQAQIKNAKKLDLLTYMQAAEPNDLIRLSGNVYTTRTHDSLKISNGKWCWWSRGIGGRSALDYLMKVKGMSLPNAVLLILGQPYYISHPLVNTMESVDEAKRLLLPEQNVSHERVISYLSSRGIHWELIDYCIQTRRLYESKAHHNAVFVGFDRHGISRFGAVRGTGASRYMGDVIGSDKRFSFSIPSREESRSLHLFESAIDLLSFGTLEKIAGRDWRKNHLLSLAGIYKPRSEITKSTLPAALDQYLKDHLEIHNLMLHLDNDMAGREAAMTITTLLSQSYSISDAPPKRGKDMNDCLRLMLEQRQHWRGDR